MLSIFRNRESAVDAITSINTIFGRVCILNLMVCVLNLWKYLEWMISSNLVDF